MSDNWTGILCALIFFMALMATLLRLGAMAFNKIASNPEASAAAKDGLTKVLNHLFGKK